MPSRRRVPPPVKMNRGTAPPNTPLHKRRRSNEHALIRARLWRHHQKAPVPDRDVTIDKSFTMPVTARAVMSCLTPPPRTLPTSEPKVSTQRHTIFVEPINLHGLSRFFASILTAVHPHLRTLHQLVPVILMATCANLFINSGSLLSRCPSLPSTTTVIWFIIFLLESLLISTFIQPTKSELSALSPSSQHSPPHLRF